MIKQIYACPRRIWAHIPRGQTIYITRALVHYTRQTFTWNLLYFSSLNSYYFDSLYESSYLLMIYECCNLSPLQMLQNSFVLSALNAILLLSSLRQFMKNNAVAGMSTFLSKNRKLRLAYPQTTDSPWQLRKPQMLWIFSITAYSRLHCGISIMMRGIIRALLSIPTFHKEFYDSAEK